MSQRRPRQPSKTESAATTRERFLSIVDHRPEYHRYGQFIPPDLFKRYEAEPWLLGMTATPADECEYYWCKSHPTVAAHTWENLLKAAEILRRGGRQFHGGDVGTILRAHDGAVAWGKEAKGLNLLSAAISSAALEEGSAAAFLRQDFLRRLEPLLTIACAAKPIEKRRGPKTAQAITRALDAAEGLGWSDDEVAALMILVGWDHTSVANMRDKLRGARRRRNSA